MKFIYTSDLHGRGKNSAKRIGDYYSDWIAKFTEIVSLAKEKGDENLIVGGDFWDRSVVSNSMVDDVVDIIETSNVKVYVTFGNHDLTMCNMEASKSSSLAHMIRRSENISFLDELEGDDFYIKGISYYYGIEEKIKEEGLICKETDKFTIAVPHAFITIKGFHPQVSHVIAKDINTNFDLILCSHFHFDWNVKKVKNTSFVNVGAVGRLSVTEINHEPKVVLVDTTTREVEIIKLQSAKPGKQVFLQENDEVVEANLDNFIQCLESSDFQGMSIAGMVEEIAKKQGLEVVEKEVVDLILNTIGELK
jgi:DNA repair exonuclease SbcCD nuclease subunit